MRLGALALGALASLCGGSAAAELSSGRLVDLTHVYDERTIFWPTARRFALESEHAGVTAAGHYYAANRFCMAEHGGTHLDAPRHFSARGRTVDAIPVDQLVGAGVVVDVARQAADDRDYRVQVADLTAWETAHGRMPDGAIVLLRTGFGRFWPDAARYMGTAERGPDAVAKLHFPGLGADAARWLVDERRLKAVGIDTPSIDHGPSTDFAAHVVLAEAQVPALENVARLAELPARGFTVIALPMKIGGGSGGPVRVVAVLPAAP